MIQLANPVWLWGLTGLLIPIAIHLLSRKEGKIINIGSIRHFQESDTARFSSIRLNEILLLLLRCLLIVILVLIIAGLNLKTNDLSTTRWVVIENGIEKEKSVETLLDSLNQKGYETRYLYPDFPTQLEGNVQAEKDYWSLVDQLKTKSRHDIIVISYNYLSGFKGQRPAMPAHIRWITYEPETAEFIIKAIKTPGDSLWIRKGKTSPEATMYETAKAKYHGQKHISLPDSKDSVDIDNTDSIRISIFSDKKFSDDLRILTASLNSIQSISPYQILINYKDPSENTDEDADWIIWLSESRFNNAGKQKSIVYATCSAYNQCLFVKGTKAQQFCLGIEKNFWVITKRLTVETALQENLSLKLAEIILNEKKVNTDLKERRTLPSEIMWSSVAEGKVNRTLDESATANIHLILGFLLILLAERAVSFKRNQ